MDEKRQRVGDTSGPLKLLGNRSIGDKGKEKIVPTFKLAWDIEQWTNLHKVFEERILDS